MTNPYHTVPVYAPAYPPDYEEARRSRGAPQRNRLAAQTLPPLNPGIHPAPTFSSDAYPPRTQSLHSSLISAAQEQAAYPARSQSLHSLVSAAQEQDTSYPARSQSLHSLMSAAQGQDSYPARSQSLHSLMSAGQEQNAYPARSQSLHSLMSAGQEQDSQGVSSYSAYTHPANPFYGGQSAVLPPSTHNSQLPQQSRPSSVNGLPRSVYTSCPTHGRLPDLLPAPPNGNGRHSFSAVSHVHQPEAVEQRPTHVVGSQGRRGILPSAAGRPVAVAGASTSGQKAEPTPPKDAQGKYPCPHCTRTYLHAKHLKRHLLRRKYCTLTYR